eukprot:4793038-Pleurochrysis_carterae.AAC.14
MLSSCQRSCAHHADDAHCAKWADFGACSGELKPFMMSFCSSVCEGRRASFQPSGDDSGTRGAHSNEKASVKVDDKSSGDSDAKSKDNAAANLKDTSAADTDTGENGDARTHASTDHAAAEALVANAPPPSVAASVRAPHLC